MRKILRGVAAVLVFVAAGCAGEQSAGGAIAGTETLAITSPTAGTALTLPFTVELASNVPLAEPETGEHHVHVFFDGDDSRYVLAYGTTVEITELPTDLPPGRHVLNASLRHADHSAAGVEAEVEVVLGPDTGTSGETGGPAGGSSGGDYGY
jgi:hypothetical protein